MSEAPITYCGEHQQTCCAVCFATLKAQLALKDAVIAEARWLWKYESDGLYDKRKFLDALSRHDKGVR